MKFEYSAGGIVFTTKEDKLLILVSQHSQHHGWVFPKGLIGDHKKGENKEDTAIREVEEETGARGEIIKPLSPITYWYVWDNEKIKKTVYYFIMQYVSGDITKHDFEMENVEWLPSNQVLERLSFKSDKKVYIEAEPLIEHLKNIT